MSIEVRFFASLREQVECEGATLEWDDGLTAEAVWQGVLGDRPIPENVLVAINMEYADLKAGVNDGDEVAFFPPVTGGGSA